MFFFSYHFSNIFIFSGGKFISIGEKIRLPDDVTLGYIVEHLLEKRLTVIEKFHSHLEPMKFLKLDSLSEQVRKHFLSYFSVFFLSIKILEAML